MRELKVRGFAISLFLTCRSYFMYAGLSFVSKEEAGISAPLTQCGVLFFKSAGMDFAHKIFIFRASEFTGIVTE